jgi:outer membrane lipoprotein-sorting protein
MMLRRPPVALPLLCLIALALSSCVAVRRQISRPGGKTTQTLLVADTATLLQIVTRQYNAIHDFSATVDLVPALGTTEKSRITEYKDIRGYILFRKPADIRIIGLYPVVRNKLFDMVSNGADFKLYLTSRNRFIEGPNSIERPSANKLENLRPQHFLDALLVRPVAAGDKVLFENFTDEDNAFYVLHTIRETPQGQLQLLRSIWFGRLDLLIARQLIFDDAGNILTDARYAQWKAYDNIAFPKHIEINRPRDEYAVVVDIVKMDINHGLSDDKFVLEQPEGTTLQILGQPPAGSKTGVPPGGGPR